MTITEWRRGLPHLATLQCEIVNRHSSICNLYRPPPSSVTLYWNARFGRGGGGGTGRRSCSINRLLSPVPSIALGTGGVQPPG